MNIQVISKSKKIRTGLCEGICYRLWKDGIPILSNRKSRRNGVIIFRTNKTIFTVEFLQRVVEDNDTSVNRFFYNECDVDGLYSKILGLVTGGK